MSAVLDRRLTRLYHAAACILFLVLCGFVSYEAGDRYRPHRVRPAGPPVPEVAPDGRRALPPTPAPEVPAGPRPAGAGHSGRIQCVESSVPSMRRPLALAAICLTAAALAAGGLGTRAEETHEAAPAIPPQGAPPPRADACLSPADMREEVSERRVIAPVAAIRAARTVIPRAEIQRASLCRHADGLVYMLTALRRDGHFVQVMVDAKTGQVAGQY